MPRYEFPTPKERTKSGRGRASPARKPPEVKSAGGNAAQMYASQIARYIANSHPACNRNGPSEPADKKEGSIKVEGTNDASISFPFLRYRRRNVGWSRSFPHIRGGRGEGGRHAFRKSSSFSLRRRWSSSETPSSGEPAHHAGKLQPKVVDGFQRSTRTTFDAAALRLSGKREFPHGSVASIFQDPFRQKRPTLSNAQASCAMRG